MPRRLVASGSEPPIEGGLRMALPFPIDLRDRIVTAGDAGLSRRALAKRFVASHSAAIKIVRRSREPGRVAPAKTGDYRKPKLSEHDELRCRRAKTGSDGGGQM